jgi:thiosulfate/3-mercaptopyruvate sulfurtransferase
VRGGTLGQSLMWLALVGSLLAAACAPVRGQQGIAPGAAELRSEIRAGDRIEPQELAAALQKPDGPLVLQVGPRTFYDQAHVAGAAYVGAAGSEAGRAALQERVRALAKDRWIVLYCGCCPWDRCPNIRPAFNELRTLGFTHVQALNLPNNFGADWVAKGYPTEK